MIIKAKPLPLFFIKLGTALLTLVFRRRFNKMIVNNIELKPNHSYLLLCNHFSFLDGFFAYYLCFKVFNKKQKINGLYTMSVKKQMEMKPWLRRTGSFSVAPGTRSVVESLNYASEILNTPGNVLLYYPQGNLESIHIRHIEFRDGVYEIVNKVKGDCQLIWCSILTEYFESTKPSVYFNLLDCGTNHDFDFEALKEQVDEYHLQALKSHVRFTKEP